MTWKRARSEEQKEQRMSEIVDVTARLYQKFRFEEITFTRIAKEAGFTRSNLYKYFSSKEEIFLTFLQQDITTWRNDLLQTYGKRKIRSVKAFASLWADVLSRHRRLLDLISILPSYLEKNVTEESLVDFKRGIIGELHVLSERLVKLFPDLSLERVGIFLEIQFATAIGLYQMTNLSELQRKVLEYPEFRGLKMDFNCSLQKTVECLLQGLIAPSSGS
jgi:AcrR family transcriptional regulator